jgi:hypothetical protein
MRGKDASALAICRKVLRGSFMTLPDELECLAQVQMASANQISTQFRIARPPKTESLPLISGNVGMFRGPHDDYAPWASATNPLHRARRGRIRLPSGRSERSVASAWTTSSCWARRICARPCESMLAITILRERTGYWTRMRQSLAMCSAVGDRSNRLCNHGCNDGPCHGTK